MSDISGDDVAGLVERPMKACNRCKQAKPLSEFYRDRTRPGGHAHRCKTCDREYHDIQLATSRDELARRARDRFKRSGRIYVRDPLKERARAAVRNAIETGRITKPMACVDCGRCAPLQAHHGDYTKPLDVEWLCTICHGRHHRIVAARPAGASA
jgi:hypothetical protein